MFHYQESCVLDRCVPEILSRSDSNLTVISSESPGEPDLRDKFPATQTSVSAIGTSWPLSLLSVCLSSPHLPQPTLRESYEDEEIAQLVPNSNFPFYSVEKLVSEIPMLE